MYIAISVIPSKIPKVPGPWALQSIPLPGNYPIYIRLLCAFFTLRPFGPHTPVWEF